MKIRIGFGLGTRATTDAARFGSLVDGLEGLGFDSLWLSERVTGECPDPMVALAVAAGRTSRLKLGTSVQVLPGRNPALLAKEWATLDRLSGGRALPAFGLGVVDPAEQQAFGVRREERSPLFDEALPLLRRLWTGEPVDHHGARFHLEGARVRPRPVQEPLEVWLGGRAPGELRRVGRLGDGWLPSFCTPDDVRAGRAMVEDAAAAQGRRMDPEHFGALVAYVHGEVPEALASLVRRRRGGDADAADVVPSGWAALRERLEQFVAVGASKFVLAPIGEPADWDVELRACADAVLDLQT